jgi:hypothetical protein
VTQRYTRTLTLAAGSPTSSSTRPEITAPLASGSVTFFTCAAASRRIGVPGRPDPGCFWPNVVSRKPGFRAVRMNSPAGSPAKANAPSSSVSIVRPCFGSPPVMVTIVRRTGRPVSTAVTTPLMAAVPAGGVTVRASRCCGPIANRKASRTLKGMGNWTP